MNLIECRGLALGYGSRRVAVCPDFTVGAGDLLAFVGPNGSGKTTALRTLAGLLPPLGGALVLADGLRRGGIGYLPQQQPNQRDFPASVREVVQSGCQASRGRRPFYTRAERARADDALARFGLGGLARQCYRDLSGGQRQRVLLARALCASRRLLLLDEPATGLDPDAAPHLHALLDGLAKDGTAIVMVTHDRAAAVQIARGVLRFGEHPSFERRRGDA